MGVKRKLESDDDFKSSNPRRRYEFKRGVDGLGVRWFG